MTSPTHAAALEQACERRSAPVGRCLALGDYYCAECESEVGPDLDADWLKRLLERVKEK